MKRMILFWVFLTFASIPVASFAGPYCTNVPASEARLVGCNLSIGSVSTGGVMLYRYAAGFTAYTFDGLDLSWTPTTPVLARGEGVVISVTAPGSVCFGDAIAPPVFPPVLPDNFIGWRLISCQSNVVANFEGIVGRAPVNGTLLSKFNPGPGRNPANVAQAPDYTTYTNTDRVWSPSVPSVAVGEAVFVYQPAAFVYQPTVLNSRIAAGKFTFEMETVYGKSATIEYTDAVPTNSWYELTTFVGDGHLKTVADPDDVSPNAQRFYRILSTSP